MSENSFRIQGFQSCKGILIPFSFNFFPVKRVLYIVILQPIPTLIEPMSKIIVSSVLNKLQILLIGNQSFGNFEILQVYLVSAALIVIRKSVSFESDRIKTIFNVDPS